MSSMTIWVQINQLTFTCSKSTTGALEKCVKYVQLNISWVCFYYLLNLNSPKKGFCWFPDDLPNQHFNVGAMLFQRWSDVENETKCDVGFSMLHNVDTTSVPTIETTLKKCWYNFISMLFQRGLNVSKSYIETNAASE